MKKRLDYREYGGAPLLGTVKPVVKAHGSSDYYAFKNGIGQLKTFIERDVIGTIENKIGI
jgi:glycerol-3-phosphate acyltransferase PlsX